MFDCLESFTFPLYNSIRLVKTNNDKSEEKKLITVNDVSLHFSDRKLFDDVNIKFTPETAMA